MGLVGDPVDECRARGILGPSGRPGRSREGCMAAELARAPGDGGRWTVRQLVVHGDNPDPSKTKVFVMVKGVFAPRMTQWNSVTLNMQERG